MANRTHTKTVHKPHAAQRVAISRARLDEADVLDWENLGMPPSTKIAPTEGVGCMAVLGGCGFAGTTFQLWSPASQSVLDV